MTNPFDWKNDKSPTIEIQTPRQRRYTKLALDKARKLVDGSPEVRPYKQPFRVQQFNPPIKDK